MSYKGCLKEKTVKKKEKKKKESKTECWWQYSEGLSWTGTFKINQQQMKDGATFLRGTAHHLWVARQQEVCVSLASLSCGDGIWFPSFPRWYTCWGQGLYLCISVSPRCWILLFTQYINQESNKWVWFKCGGIFKNIFLIQFLPFAAGPGMEKKGEGGVCLQRSLRTLCTGQRLKAHLVLILCLVCKVDLRANTLDAAQLKLPATWYL